MNRSNEGLSNFGVNRKNPKRNFSSKQRASKYESGRRGNDTLLTGLAHSTLDFDVGLGDEEGQGQILYNYTEYSGSRDLKIKRAIAFEDYNYDNGMGFGLQAAEFIDKGSTIFEVPTHSTYCGKNFFNLVQCNYLCFNLHSL